MIIVCKVGLAGYAFGFLTNTELNSTNLNICVPYVYQMA